MREFSIGEVSIMHNGESLMGEPRVNALRTFFQTKRLPEGMEAVSWNPRTEVKWEEVRWDTAGKGVTD